MEGSVKTALLGVAVLVLIGAAFWAGTVVNGPVDAAGSAAGGDAQGMRGGGFPGLTEDERAAFENMSDEERQSWMQENMADRPGGAQGGPARGGTLEGKVIEATGESLTISLESGSQTVYLDDTTVIAFVKGAGELDSGASVMVIAGPAAGVPGADSATTDVVTASVVVVM